MKKDLLPLPTEDSDIRHFALCAIANMDLNTEKRVLESESGIPTCLRGYIPEYVRNYRCLFLIRRKYGLGEVEKLHAEFKALSFIEKMRLGVFEGGIEIIPGAGTGKPLNLLLF